MPERDQLDLPPEVPPELEDVYRAAFLAAYAESPEPRAQVSTTDEMPAEPQPEPGPRPVVAPPAPAPRPAALTPLRPPRPSAWEGFRTSPWFAPLVLATLAVVLILLAYFAGQALATSLS